MDIDPQKDIVDDFLKNSTDEEKERMFAALLEFVDGDYLSKEESEEFLRNY